jgi:hypothetical protein
MTRKPSKGSITAGELQAQLLNDADWVAARKARDAELEARHAKHLATMADLERELKGAGIDVENYRSLIHKPKNYKLGIPIFLRHMRFDHYTDWERNSMAQAIAMKESNPYWSELLDMLLSVVGKEEHYSFEQGLAVALAASYKAPQFETLLSLCENTDYRAPRALLVEGLKKSRDPRAEITLMKLCSDPYLGKELTKWMKRREKRRNAEGRNDVSAFN